MVLFKPWGPEDYLGYHDGAPGCTSRAISGYVQRTT